MKHYLGLIVGAIMALTGAAANASTIDTSGYDTSTAVLTNESGFVFYDGFGDFFDAFDFGGQVTVTSAFFVSSPLTSSSFVPAAPAPIVGNLTQISVATEVVEFLFEDSGLGFLVTVDVTGQGLDFTDPLGFVATDAFISLTELSNAPAIPLPAGLPLLLTGLGGMVVLRRKKAS
jgi:hypothetical protein